MASTKLSALTATTTAAAVDLMYVVKDPAGVDTSNKITFANFEASLTLANQVGYSLLGLKAGTLAQFAATTSAQLAGVISDETGSGVLVFATSPTLVTPTLGVASATTINKVTITAPATGSTLTIADGKTFTANDTVTVGTAGLTLGNSGGLVVGASKVLTVNNSITLAGTDATTMTFPTTSASVARTDAGQTFTGVQIITSLTLPDQGQIKMTVPTTDLKATGPTCGDFNCGYTSSAIGDLVYLDSSSTWQKTDANTAALYNGFLAVALEVKASGAALLVALPGSFIYSTTGFPTWTIGSPIYMSETAGAMTQTAPTTTDSATRVVGWGVHADKMWFQPSPDYITHT